MDNDLLECTVCRTSRCLTSAQMKNLKADTFKCTDVYSEEGCRRVKDKYDAVPKTLQNTALDLSLDTAKACFARLRSKFPRVQDSCFVFEHAYDPAMTESLKNKSVEDMFKMLKRIKEDLKTKFRNAKNWPDIGCVVDENDVECEPELNPSYLIWYITELDQNILWDSIEAEEKMHETEMLCSSVISVPSQAEALKESEDKAKEGKDKPKESQDKPKEGQDKPKESKDKPKESKDKPKESKDKPKESQDKPKESKDKPKESQDKPKEGKDKPKEGKDKPKEGKDKQKESKDKPKEGKEKPKESQEKPKESQDKPKENKSRSKTTEMNLEDAMIDDDCEAIKLNEQKELEEKAKKEAEAKAKKEADDKAKKSNSRKRVRTSEADGEPEKSVDSEKNDAKSAAKDGKEIESAAKDGKEIESAAKDGKEVESAAKDGKEVERAAKDGKDGKLPPVSRREWVTNPKFDRSAYLAHEGKFTKKPRTEPAAQDDELAICKAIMEAQQEVIAAQDKLNKLYQQHAALAHRKSLPSTPK